MKHEAYIAFLSVVASLAASAVVTVPEVSGVSLEQAEGSRLVTIHYTLADAPAIVTVDICTNGVTIGDANLHYFTGDCNRIVSPGANKTVCWQADKSWPGHRITDGSVTAKVYAWALDNPPDYMVVNLLAEKTINYYTSADALPDGGLTNNVYRKDRLVMRRIHASGETFVRGSNELAENDAYYAREKAHQVSLDHDYWIGVFELTAAQYAQIGGPSVSSYYSTTLSEAHSYRPKGYMFIGWVRESANGATNAVYRYPNPPHADSLIGRIRAKSGLAFELPSETEWEYACRAGTGDGVWNDRTPYVATMATTSDCPTDSALDALGRYWMNGGRRTSAGALWADSTDATNAVTIVGTYLPNAWGLYDMHGNASELCLDYFKEDVSALEGAVNMEEDADAKHTYRGGTAFDRPRDCRSAARKEVATKTSYTSGFQEGSARGVRLVCPIGE